MLLIEPRFSVGSGTENGRAGCDIFPFPHQVDIGVVMVKLSSEPWFKPELNH